MTKTLKLQPHSCSLWKEQKTLTMKSRVQVLSRRSHLEENSASPKAHGYKRETIVVEMEERGRQMNAAKNCEANVYYNVY
jgi:hypothetical protein